MSHKVIRGYNIDGREHNVRTTDEVGSKMDHRTAIKRHMTKHKYGVHEDPVQGFASPTEAHKAAHKESKKPMKGKKFGLMGPR